MAQQRSLHSTAPQAAEVPSTFHDRAQIQGSAWSKPPQASQDADENVVPAYYVERKRQRDAITQRKEEEGGLMAELNAGILSDGLAARTRVREEKIPVEVRAADGSVVHPSGFEPPTPETAFHPAAAKVPEGQPDPDAPVATMKQLWDERKFQAGPPHGARRRIDPAVHKNILKRVLKAQVAQADARARQAERESAEKQAAQSKSKYGASDAREHAVRAADASESSFEQRAEMPVSAWDQPGRVRTGVRPSDDVVPSYYIERKRQRAALAVRKEEEGGLMHELSAGILSDDVGVDMRIREEKIPVEVRAADGSRVHPSGYVPPTPETEFHPVAAKSSSSPPKTPWTALPPKGQGASDGNASAANL